MATITYIVKVASGKFTIDDAVAPKLTFRDGDTYVFDQADNSNSGHTLQFSATSNNSGSSEYTTGVTKSGTAGSAGAKTTIVTSGSTTDTLYYYSSGGGTHGAEFSNTGYKTSSNYNFLKPIVGSTLSEEKWGGMLNHMVDQIDQNIQAQDLDGATDSGTVAVDLDTQSLTVAGSNGIATSGSGQTITVSGEALAHQGEPHIQLQKLYPAVAGKLLDGSTSHSGDYGTAQSDGRKYYYTDIKGSREIADPRIGAHFGATRHRTSSVQLREQETATHGKDVYSVDGRDWIRIVGDNGSAYYNTGGTVASCWDTDNFWEITFYGNQLLVQQDNHNANRGWTVTIDGGTASAERSPAQGSIDGGVLGGRYVNAGSIGNTQMSETLGIHTVKLTPNGASDECTFNAIETIAQDTTSTANKSKIQIPSQNVVSYGKKFTVSGTPHYDPFNGFTSGNLAAVQALIETDTSLGMANWLSSSTYYRPFNGGRVVKWVDSSGNIKTSVTMMPPNAQNIGGTASNAIDLSSSQTNDDTINFNTSAIDHSLSEVAKQYHWSEFGNGSANAGTGGSYKDWSMNNASSHERAYVMDDGLTSLSSDHAVFGADAENDVLGCRIAVDTGVQNTYFTFIGTGISAELKEWDSGAKFDAVGFQTLAQNLPYGTHVIKIARDNTGTDQVTLLVDGISAQVEAFNVDHNALETLRFMSFHQPKKPPIPEDAVVLADYMLVADFVKTGTSGMDVISKGVRKISLTRDEFVDSSSALGANVE